MAVKPAQRQHCLTSNTSCLESVLSFWIANTNLPIGPGLVAFHLLKTLANPRQNAAIKARKRTKASSVVIAVIGVSQLSCRTLLLMLIVFHGFNNSIDEARVKIGSTPVIFALFDDLFNWASRHVWLVLLLNSFCCANLVVIIKNAAGQHALLRSLADEATTPNGKCLIQIHALPSRLTKLVL